MTVETLPRARARRARSSVARRILRGTGWTLITVGVLLLLFVAYELFGTNLITDRYQRTLKADLSVQFDRVRSAGGRPPKPKAIPGEALGIIRIPKIGLSAAFVEGVSTDDLKKGPGHYPATPLPGEEGNFALAGHRTTYGKPFWSLDKLRAGDEIFIRTTEGQFVYRVLWQRVVHPSQSEVLDPTRRPVVTLTTCSPRFSAAERLIIRAEMVRAPPTGDTA